MIKTMASDPIVFAMANPVPEIGYDDAKAAGVAVMGTGRSDKPNQINNLLCFPGIFKGALYVQASNVMLIVFLLSLMPQFISPEDDYVSRVTLLSVLFVGICFLVHLGYSAIAAVARKWLAGPNFSIWLNRVSGALFWLLGLSVIWNALFNR